MKTWALVPVKSFARGKSRLAGALDDAGRQRVARALFERVLCALQATPVLAGTIVLTDGDDVAEAALGLGARVRRDGTDESLSAIIDAGLAEVSGHADAALVVMGDLPRLTAPGLTRVVRSLRRAQVVVVPDPSGHGTSLLGLRPPQALGSTWFGRPDSGLRHRGAAQARGQRVQVLYEPRLGFDVDVPGELRLARLR